MQRAVPPRGEARTDVEIAIGLRDKLRERGLLSVGAGDNVVRILPPLIITDKDVREAIGILNDACASLAVHPSKVATK